MNEQVGEKNKFEQTETVTEQAIAQVHERMKKLRFRKMWYKVK